MSATIPGDSSNAIEPAPIAAECTPFASLLELWESQAKLRELRLEEPDGGEVWGAVKAFVRRGVATGAVIEDDDDRWSIQSLLDYWATAIERAGRPRIDSSLAEFDPESVPQLPDDACPYLGLNAFQEENQEVFFGREALVERLVEHLGTHRMVALVGPSGCGKSSLAFAGLVPRLRQRAVGNADSWYVRPPIVPGSTPRANLAALLQTGESRNEHHACVVVIDQFEELFTHCKSEDERVGFVADLLSLVMGSVPHRVVITIRSDFESFIARHSALYEIYVASRIAVTPPNASELRRAIEAPADLVGLKFETGIVDSLLQELLGEPAGLPLLQFTLRRLWDERVRNRITAAAYERVGGGRQALARTADAIYDAMIPEDQTTARRILLHLGLAIDSEHELTRARVPRSRLFEQADDPGRVGRVLDRLIAARLVRQTSNRQDELQAEVAHEALVRNWPRLADWMQEARTSLTEHRRLEAKAMEWVRLGRGRSALLDDVELSDAERVAADAAGRGVHASVDLTALVTASRRRVQAMQRRRRSLLVAGIAAIVALVVMLGLTLWQYKIAQGARAREQQEQRHTTHLLGMADMEQGRVLVLGGHPMQALPYFVAARMAGIDSRPLRMLFGLASRDVPLGTLVGHTAAVTSVAFSRDGRQVVTASQDNTARVWDVATGRPLTKPLEHHGFVTAAAFSPDDRRIVTAGGDGTVRVWDAATGTLTIDLLKHHGYVTSAVFSPDGTRIVTASWDKTASVWNAKTGTRVAGPLEHRGPVTSAAFSPDGRRIVSASGDNSVRVWDAATGEPLTGPLEHLGPVTFAVFSPDGTCVVTASEDNTVRVWDAATGAAVTTFEHRGFVTAATFSPDGTRIVTASGDRTARVWDAKTGAPVTGPLEHQDAVRAAAFSPDGTRVVTASDDKTARVWDAATGAPVTGPLEHQDTVRAAAFSLDGTRVVTASDDKTARVWDATIRKTAAGPLEHRGPVNAAAFSSDGARVVTASDDRTAQVWDAATSTPAAGPLEHQGPVTAASFSPDGTRVVTVSNGEAARIWDTASAKQVIGLFVDDGLVTAAAFSPDGTRVVTVNDDKTVRVWNAATGTPMTQPLKHRDFVNAAVFSPDGRRVATACNDQTAQVWDAETGKLVTGPLEHHGRVIAIAFSSDGMRVVTASRDGTARVWEVATGKPVTGPLEHRGPVNAAAFSPDGRRVVTASNDKTAQVWEVATGKPVAGPLKHQDAVRAAAFSSDGTLVVTASEDKTARVWDAATSKPVTEPLRHQDTVYAAVFSPDGTRVVTASNDKTAKVWEFIVDAHSLEEWRAVERCGPFALVDSVFTINASPAASCERR
jgi:WD40 repeat protein